MSRSSSRAGTVAAGPGTRVLVEACVTSKAEAEQCFRAGAMRAELCSDLESGGLTPPTHEITSVLGTGPIVVMARRKPDTFELDPAGTSRLVEDVASIARLGADGVVVGALDRRRRIDRAALGELVSAAKGLPVTFHRAFDLVPSPLEEVEVLMRTGVARVLTAGGAATAWEGRGALRDLVAVCGAELTVLGGGGIRGDHVRRLVDATGLTEVHARASAIPAIIEALG